MNTTGGMEEMVAKDSSWIKLRSELVILIVAVIPLLGLLFKGQSEQSYVMKEIQVKVDGNLSKFQKQVELNEQRIDMLEKLLAEEKVRVSEEKANVEEEKKKASSSRPGGS